MNRLRLLLPVLALAGASVLAAAPVDAGGRPLSASLAATNEVLPAAPGEVGKTGSAAITLNQGQGKICFDLDTNVTNPTVAHIHRGAVGANGPVVVQLSLTDGCVSADRTLIKEIRQHPARFYVNIHSVTNTAGAVRGQLAP